MTCGAQVERGGFACGRIVPTDSERDAVLLGCLGVRVSCGCGGGGYCVFGRLGGRFGCCAFGVVVGRALAWVGCVGGGCFRDGCVRCCLDVRVARCERRCRAHACDECERKGNREHCGRAPEDSGQFRRRWASILPWVLGFWAVSGGGCSLSAPPTWGNTGSSVECGDRNTLVE